MRKLSVLSFCLLLAACSSPAQQALLAAEGLASQGKHGEAAEKLETVCALAPDGKECPVAEQRAADAWGKVAEQALSEGRYREAEEGLWRARAFASGAARAAIDERLAKADLVLGAKVERAKVLADKARARAIFEEVATQEVPAAGAAKEWLKVETPALLAAAVLEACGPRHEGSCVGAWGAVEAAKVTGESVDRAREVFQAEQRRVHPLRVQAEGFLPLFAARSRPERVYSDCWNEFRPRDLMEREWENLCAMKAWGEDPADERFVRQKNQDALWRRTLKAIADPAYTAPLIARRDLAAARGEAKREVIPAPPPAPKKK